MPKGVYNRSKKKDEPMVVPPPVVEEKNVKQVGHSVYMPSPDMGEIKPPPEGKKTCGCTHEKETHYGGSRGHCNTSGCECLEFK